MIMAITPLQLQPWVQTLWDTLRLDKYPWLDENEIKKLEEFKNVAWPWVSESELYQQALQEKEQFRIQQQKTAIKNELIYKGVTEKNNWYIGQSKKLDVDDAIISKGRQFAADKWIDPNTISDEMIINMFKERNSPETYNELLNGQKNIEDIYPVTEEENPMAAILGYWAIWFWLYKKLYNKPEQKPSIGGTFPLPSKKVQQVESLILNDILNASKTDTTIDKDAIVTTFSKHFWPVKNFDELFSQSKALLGNSEWNVINERNKMIAKYNKSHGYEYMDGLIEYRKELASDPQVTKTKLEKIDEIIAKEQAFMKANGDTIDSVKLNDRKEILNNNLKRFLGKDISTLPEADFVEQQALNKLRAWAMWVVESIDEGTPDAGKIKEFNKEYKTLVDINDLAKTQASKFKQVPQPTTLKRVLGTVREVTKNIPFVSLGTAFLHNQILNKDEVTILKLEKYMQQANKYASMMGKWWGKILWGLMILWAINELTNSGKAMASEWNADFESNIANEPRFKDATMSPGTAPLVNPEAQIFKWDQLASQWPDAAPMTTYLIPWIWNAIGTIDLASTALNWTEGKARKFINSFTKMSKEEQASLEKDVQSRIDSTVNNNNITPDKIGNLSTPEKWLSIDLEAIDWATRNAIEDEMATGKTMDEAIRILFDVNDLYNYKNPLHNYVREDGKFISEDMRGNKSQRAMTDTILPIENQ